MIHVVNQALKSARGNYRIQPYATVVNIMRPGVLGNPFALPLVASLEHREQVVENFMWHLFSQMRRKFLYKEPGTFEVFDEMERLYWIHREEGDLILECCCFPKLCHGNVIKAVLEAMEQEGPDNWSWYFLQTNHWCTFKYEK